MGGGLQDELLLVTFSVSWVMLPHMLLLCLNVSFSERESPAASICEQTFERFVKRNRGTTQWQQVKQIPLIANCSANSGFSPSPRFILSLILSPSISLSLYLPPPAASQPFPLFIALEGASLLPVCWWPLPFTPTASHFLYHVARSLWRWFPKQNIFLWPNS